MAKKSKAKPKTSFIVTVRVDVVLTGQPAPILKHTIRDFVESRLNGQTLQSAAGMEIGVVSAKVRPGAVDLQ